MTVTLLTHDSFAADRRACSRTSRRGPASRSRSSPGGDAGEVVNKAVLTAGNPEGDVLFGVDNTLLTRALSTRVSSRLPLAERRRASGRSSRDHTGDGQVTPVDYGDVCVNIDDAWFASHHLAPPQDVRRPDEPAYKDLLVVENPATSSPGLAFLLATIARYGERRLADVLGGPAGQRRQGRQRLDEAYDGDFSGSSGKGDRPLVRVLRLQPARGDRLCRRPEADHAGTSR